MGAGTGQENLGAHRALRDRYKDKGPRRGPLLASPRRGGGDWEIRFAPAAFTYVALRLMVSFAAVDAAVMLASAMSVAFLATLL